MPAAPTTAPELTDRARALLAAVAAGRAELTQSCEPDMFIDGLCCCDQATAHQLARAGLIAPSATVPLGCRVRAVLTRAGANVLCASRLPRNPFPSRN